MDIMRTGDIRLVKKINDRVVLNLIREHGKISGSMLSQITGMRPSTISSILKDLQKRALIKNLGKGESTSRGGKRPYIWTIKSDEEYVIGIDLEIGEITAVVLDLSAGIVAKKIYQVPVVSNLDELVEQIESCVNEIIDFAKVDKIMGVGLAIAGVVNRDEGIVVKTDVLVDLNIGLIEKLEDVFSFPVIIENNANATAIGEKWTGAAGGIKNFMTVLIEVNKNVGGLGIGLVFNEELYHGANYCSGELNIHLPTLHDSLGTMSNRLVEGKILRTYAQSIADIDIYIMLDAAKQGDEIALLYFSILGHLIGKSIANSVALINPELVILAGDIAELDSKISEPIKRVIEMETLNITSESLQVVASTQGRYATGIGAASLVLNEFFKVPVIKENEAIGF
jgi:predicted NBD/HSP70 family sugar kinase